MGFSSVCEVLPGQVPVGSVAKRRLGVGPDPTLLLPAFLTSGRYGPIFLGGFLLVETKRGRPTLGSLTRPSLTGDR